MAEKTILMTSFESKGFPYKDQVVKLFIVMGFTLRIPNM